MTEPFTEPLKFEAIAPAWLGSKIHIFLEGYQPGKKTRTLSFQPMCGQFTSSRARRVPLAQALQWPDRVFDEDDPRKTRTWCAACVGHAAGAAGLLPDFVEQIALGTHDKWERRFIDLGFAIAQLIHSTDGEPLYDDVQVPVGEIRRVLADVDALAQRDRRPAGDGGMTRDQIEQVAAAGYFSGRMLPVLPSAQEEGQR
jgi:hypothetical protein